MKKNVLIAGLLIMCGFSAQAVEISGLTVNGEVAFDYNFLSTKSTAMPYTDSVNNEAYRLRNAQILISKETDQIYFLTRLAYTPTTYVSAVDTTGPTVTSSTNNFGALEQAEIFYKPMQNLYVGFGRFLTTMGYESLMKYENAFYTTTIAYQSIVPGYGEGLRAKYVAGDWLTATLSTYNQAKYGAFGDDYTPTKTTELSFTGKIAGDFTWFAGYYLGTDKPDTTKPKVENSASSVWASYQITENMLAALIYDSYTTKPDGSGTQWADASTALITYGLGMNNLALRYEMVRGAGTLAYGTGEKVDSLTVGDKIVLNENLNVYVEYRMDKADEKVFVDADGSPTDSANVITLGALAHF
ncbi:porin [Bdellovibrio bacteriovorus]|uniref:porin n=1 Tax=Bdellovibrio bacteriovorus TaxID=959 RepID=UPI0021D38BE3|nr:porin [Bdellovibrio bacteriovorus]UXR65348.1 porin [Bdellovibrio bacteriovorus]